MVALHRFSDLCGFSNDDSGSVVDKERRADLRAWMDVDAGKAMDLLGDDTRDIWDIKLIESVRDSVIGDGEEAWVSVDDLREGFASWVAFVEEVEVSV